MWTVSARDLDAITLGAAILGTGGGGNPYIGKLRALQLLRSGHAIRVLGRDELADDAHVVTCGGMGAPVVGIEKVEKGDEVLQAVQAVGRQAGVRLDAIIPSEMGGSNSIEPMIAAALAGVPVLDADGMGRAFHELQMSTFFVYGAAWCPTAVADEKGNVAVITQAASAVHVERLARACTVQMGATAGYAMALMTGAQAKRVAVWNTLTLARDLGEAVFAARGEKRDPVQAILETAGGRRLFEGKIVDVQRRISQGFARGEMRLEGSGRDAGCDLHIAFQNENLVARQGERYLAMVPDLICLVDPETGEPLTTEVLRYGLRAAVLGLPCHDLLRTPEALRVMGPRAFGYDFDYAALLDREVIR